MENDNNENFDNIQTDGIENNINSYHPTVKRIPEYSTETKKTSSNSSFSKTVFVPFLSGIIGASLVLGTCFGVPSIKNSIIGNTSSNSSVVNYTPGASSTAISLTDYSDTTINSWYSNSIFSYIFLWWYFNCHSFWFWNNY